MNHTYDVVIVGAGMVGAALAAGLGRDGFSVALIDQAAPSTFDPASPPDIRVSAISLGSERYLTHIGAWPLIRQCRLTPYRRLAVWDETRHPLSSLLPGKLADVTFDAASLSTGHLGHIVENSVTQNALWDVATAQETVSPYSGRTVATLENASDAVEITLDDGSQLTGKLVIGADGAQSAVRQLAGIGVNRDQYDQQAMVISVRYSGPVEDITWQGFYPSGPRAFLPLHNAGEGESWASLVWYDAPEEITRLKSLDNDALMSEIQRSFPSELPPLCHIESRASFPIARQHAKQYHRERVVLIGDSAHTINPLAGQGVNLGFQDANVLHRLLREARRAGADLADARWLEDYEAERRPANQRMMLAMDVFYHLFSNQSPPLHLLRNLGLGVAKALPFARNQVARYAMGIEEELPPVVRQLAQRLPGFKHV